MKKNQLPLLILATGLLMGACDTKKTTSTKDGVELVEVSTSKAEEAAVMSFAETRFDFGEITEGDVVQHTFHFTNTGKSALIIQNAVGSCGCTVPDFPRDPIAPGASGDIKVSFNSKGKAGMQLKTVTVVANTLPQENKVEIQANVKQTETQMH
jgi:hypothetical protein